MCVCVLFNVGNVGCYFTRMNNPKQNKKKRVWKFGCDVIRNEGLLNCQCTINVWHIVLFFCGLFSYWLHSEGLQYNRDYV